MLLKFILFLFYINYNYFIFFFKKELTKEKEYKKLWDNYIKTHLNYIKSVSKMFRLLTNSYVSHYNLINYLCLT